MSDASHLEVQLVQLFFIVLFMQLNLYMSRAIKQIHIQLNTVHPVLLYFCCWKSGLKPSMLIYWIGFNIQHSFLTSLDRYFELLIESHHNLYPSCEVESYLINFKCSKCVFYLSAHVRYGLWWSLSLNFYISYFFCENQ
jgi:hypothetical protein